MDGPVANKSFIAGCLFMYIGLGAILGLRSGLAF